MGGRRQGGGMGGGMGGLALGAGAGLLGVSLVLPFLRFD
jgi:hypothetical protein